jgi:hypothetical protein
MTSALAVIAMSEAKKQSGNIDLFYTLFSWIALVCASQ